MNLHHDSTVSEQAFDLLPTRRVAYNLATEHRGDANVGKI